MIISANKMQTLKASPNSAYEVILSEFLCQSNKIEGSTFTFEQVELFYATNKVTGDHYFEDIIETKNSFKMFDQNLALTGGLPSIMENGAKINATELLALNIYSTYNINAKWHGAAQAKAVVFFILVAVLALAQQAATRSKEVQQ